jgi:hypothetical protein
MTNPQAILRSLIVYGVCLPLAVFLGIVITNPLDFTTLTVVGLVLFVIVVPILLRFHRPLMLFAWNSCIVVFFLPGRPQLSLAAVFVSFLIYLGHVTLDKRFRFISVPSLKWPLVAIVVVVVITAKATGGIGIRSLGGDVYGGRRYIELLIAILGYFAMSAEAIPASRVNLYIGLFFLGALTNFLPDLYPICPSYLRAIFLFTPPYILPKGGFEVGETRLVGFAGAGAGVITYMLARYGVRGILSPAKPWRTVIFVLFIGLSLLGGFRSTIIMFALTFGILFFLEGLHKTSLMPAFTVVGILLATLTLVFLPHLPFTFQRALAFLPVDVDPVARQSAQSSSDWRMAMWKVMLPQVPHYLLLGKGYSLSRDDYELGSRSQNQSGFEEQWGATMAGDYHNGPLEVLITFGMWGMIAFLWFLSASWRALLRNYRYGDPSLRTVNSLLLASFVVHTLMFFFVVGGFHADMLPLAGLVGLSVSLNNGVANPATEQVQETSAASDFAGIVSRPRSAFER